MASTRAHTTNSNSKSTPKYRLDGAELKPPTPHAFTLPNTSEIRRLNRWLQHEDLTLQEFGEKLAQYGGLGRYVVAIANHRGRHRETSIREPVHAAAFLGISGLQKILEPLIEE